MGLDISTGSFGFRAGSYSGFTDFRDWLAMKLGFENSEQYYEKYNEDCGEWNNKMGMNKNANQIPLGPLMFHSDCDGTIGPKFATRLLKDLKELKNLIPKKYKKTDLDEEWNRAKLDDWITACEESVKSKDNIHFH